MIANEIMDKLTQEASKTLSHTLGASRLEKFTVTALGNMPYYYDDPNGYGFNSKTYNWIRAGLKRNDNGVELDQPFTNVYIDALSKVNYSLSSKDQAALNEAQENTTNQQGALIEHWKSVHGDFPNKDENPIDYIVNVICNKWATTPTTLTNLQNSTEINEVLNNVNASDKPILDTFANWLNTIGSTSSIIDNSVLNNAYLRKALNAVKKPSNTNGGILLNNNKDNYYPAFQVNTELSRILNSLNSVNADKSKITLSMDISNSKDNEFNVSIAGGVTLKMPVLDFFKINVNGNASYFQDTVSKNSESIKISMTFTGVNLVNFGPVNFDESTQKNWYFTKPIMDAINNGDKDVSGYKFSPMPQIDFSNKGPFGFLTGAVISNYPSINLTIKSSQYDSFAKDISQSTSMGLSFLGIPLGINAKESTYSHSASVDSSNKEITMTFTPPTQIVSGPATDSLAWVIGVQTNYPCS